MTPCDFSNLMLVRWEKTGCLLESEHDVTCSQLLVDLGESLQLFFQVLLVLLVNEDLVQLRTIGLETDTLTDNDGRCNDIVQDSVVDSSQGTRVCTLGVGPTSHVFGEDGTLCNEENVSVGELLFNFNDQTLLDTLETLVLTEGDEDNISLTVVSNLDFLDRADGQVLDFCVDFRQLDFTDSLSNGLFQCGDCLTLSFDDLGHSPCKVVKRMVMVGEEKRVSTEVGRVQQVEAWCGGNSEQDHGLDGCTTGPHWWWGWC